jgi:AmpD protein
VGQAPLAVGLDGWLPGLRHLPSPHHDQRPAGTAVDLLVIHNISLPPGHYGGGVIERLFLGQGLAAASPFFDLLAGLRVSAHFLVDRSGAIVQFVSCSDRAWHAGTSSFGGRDNCNDYSIGIELEGCDFTPFEPAQYAALGRLTRALVLAYPLRAVRGHSDIAAGRKTDPGPQFDWQRYARLAALPDLLLR